MANAREMLNVVGNWLGDQEEGLSYGLRNAFDALRLYDYWQAHENALSEMVEEWPHEERVAALGYDPLDEKGVEHKTTGAAEAVEAMLSAWTLLDSVAFVSKQGDTQNPIRLLDTVLAK